MGFLEIFNLLEHRFSVKVFDLYELINYTTHCSYYVFIRQVKHQFSGRKS